MAKNYYAILGLTVDATADDIKAAYCRLAKEYHPDRYRGGGRPFLEVQEAYSVLGDADRRKRYARSIAARDPDRNLRPLGRVLHRRNTAGENLESVNLLEISPRL